MALQPNQLVLKNVRSAFLTLDQAVEYETGDGRPRFSATALVPYSSPIVKQVEAVMLATAEAKWGKKGKAILDAALLDKMTTCWLDGKRKPEYDGFEGHWSLVAHRPAKSGRPLVIDTDTTPIFDGKGEFMEGKNGRIYSGCFVNIKVGFWCQDNAKGKAIRAELLTIQSLFRGDSFGGGAKSTDEGFEAVTDGADDEDLS